ncbi:MAG: hypothetical protein CVU39_13460 [Chloroflexi bacterium HGW-Chloroflexi-10]|nr:MAG: hypothetical protein CVU39_13460 [Chloroflexi bacterium HGW-Chloroflexi-10]
MKNFEPTNEFENQLREAVRVTDASPEFVQNLKMEILSTPQKQTRQPQRLVLRPAWALGLSLALVLVIATLPSAVNAFRQLFGFVPGIGLVEQNRPLKMIAQPVSETRDGITLTVEQVLVYDDHIEAAYSVEGIAAEMRQADNHPDTAALYCNGADMYPNLQLTDGSVVQADPMALGGQWLSAGYNAGHSFSAGLPTETSEITFTLDCLQETKRGGAPENWAIALRLVSVPQDMVIGEPVYAVDPAENAPVSGAGIHFTLENVVPQEDGYHFFFRFNTQNDAPDFLNAAPGRMQVIDSKGNSIELINALPWSPFEQVDVWEYRSVRMPAKGPLEIVIDGAQLFYAAQKHSFEFSPGENPQPGQTWTIEEHFQVGEIGFTVLSAEMVTWEGHQGFQFVMEADQSDTKFYAEVLDMTPSDPQFEMWSTFGSNAPAQRITPGFVYRDEIPQNILVTFNTVTETVDETWKLEWNPPAE